MTRISAFETDNRFRKTSVNNRYTVYYEQYITSIIEPQHDKTKQPAAKVIDL